MNSLIMEEAIPKIIVAGAGISGMRAAIDLAELGCAVLLVEKGPAPGGVLNWLDRQFPDNHCGMCRMLSAGDRGDGVQTCLRKGLFHDRIELVRCAQIRTVQGSPGRLTVEIQETATGVDPARCTGCGDCEAVCPESAPDRFNAGLTRRKAVYLPVPHQAPFFRVIDWNACSRCGACLEACADGAITLDNATRTRTETEVAAVVDAAGPGLHDPWQTDLYGAGVLSDVVTAADFERILSSSGPFGGKPVRPSNGRPLEKVAWIQCVGSRNAAGGIDTCSSVCCMFALKEAVLARERLGPAADLAIFYMDLRTFGRDDQRYLDRTRKDARLRLIRCRIHSVGCGESLQDPVITYVDETGCQIDEPFDMVVLSTGRKAKNAPEWMGNDGVVAVHPDGELTDIAGSVTAADAAVHDVAARLVREGHLPFDLPGRSAPDPHFEEKHPNLLVALLPGAAGGPGPDLEELARHLSGPALGAAVVILPTASEGTDPWTEVVEKLTRGGCNRLVVAGPVHPLALAAAFGRLEKAAGVPRDCMAAVQWSAGGDPAQTTRGGLAAEIAVTAARLRNRMAEPAAQVQVLRSALVVGGGPAGLAAAAALSACDVAVTLVEKEDRLGGNMARFTDSGARDRIEALRRSVMEQEGVTVLTAARVTDHRGTAGKFTAQVRLDSGKTLGVDCGAVILAAGGGPAPEPEPVHERVVTLNRFRDLMTEKAFSEAPPNQVVMIQCQGSRQEPRNFCSRICCPASLRTAMEVRRRWPQTRVVILYRDMMTYGASEELYADARKNGVIFIPFDSAACPEVSAGAELPRVEAFDPILGESMDFTPDWVCLATGVIPSPMDDLVRIFGIDRTADGFLRESDAKWRPLDVGREGVFVCGLARGPVRADEAVAQGKAAALRAFRLLARPVMPTALSTARVRSALCTGCGMCVPVCPYGARRLSGEKAVLEAGACRGCGACVVACPNSATVLDGFEQKGILEAIEAAL